MPAITTNDLKTGITLELDTGLFQVVEFQHVKPGKGGAFVRTKLRNVKTGNVFDRTFNAGIRVEQAIINREEMQFLYRDGDDYVFMNNETYDQMHVAPVALGDAADYMVEGMTAQVAFFQGEVQQLEQAARIDGATRFEAFVKIAVPVAAPGLLAAGLLAFILSWNEFLFALILTGKATNTLPVGLAGFQTQRGVEIALLAAATMVAIVPVLILLPFMRRYLIKGLSLGALK